MTVLPGRRCSEAPAPSLLRELRRAFRDLLVVVGLLLATMLAATAWVGEVIQPRVAGYTEVTRDLRLGHEAMLDQETALRGWLATGDARFLDPYLPAARIADRSSRDLQVSSVADAVLDAQIVDVLVTQDAWRRDWAAAALARDVSRRPMSRVALAEMLAEGKQMFDDYRRAQQVAVGVASRRRDDALATEPRVLAAMTVGQVLLGAGALLVVLVRARRLLRLVQAPVRALQAAVAEVRRGKVLEHAPAVHVGELQDVAAGLADLSQAVQRERETSHRREMDARVLAEQLGTVLAAARAMAGCDTAERLARVVVSDSARLTGAAAALWSQDRDGVWTCLAWSDAHTPRPHGEPVLVRVTALRGCRQDDASACAFPLTGRAGVLAVLHLQAVPPAEADPAIEALTLTAAANLQAARLTAATLAQATTDALTGLGNRHQLEQDLTEEWARSTRHARPLSLLLLDLDHFKALNDTDGHLAGDAWLRLVAAAVTEHVRTGDGVYRYGGEEIVVLLPETAEADAATLAERLRAAVETLPGPVPSRSLTSALVTSVTASIGVAEREVAMGSASDLLAAADQALYAAKRAGRNLAVRASLVTTSLPGG